LLLFISLCSPCCYCSSSSVHPVVTVHLPLCTLLLLFISLCAPCCYCSSPSAHPVVTVHLPLRTLLLLFISLCAPCCYCSSPSAHPVVTAHSSHCLHTLLLQHTSLYALLLLFISLCAPCCYCPLLSLSAHPVVTAHLSVRPVVTQPSMSLTRTRPIRHTCLHFTRNCFQNTKLTKPHISAQYYFRVLTFPPHETLLQLMFQLQTSLLSHSSTILKHDVHLFTFDRKNSADRSAVVGVVSLQASRR
jgi:hypothetical protein